MLARRCRELGIRPVLIRRYGRVDRTRPRHWGMVDCRPGREVVRWGQLPTDEHLLDVLAGKDHGTVSGEPVYLVCTHGRHDACCAVRGRPVAAALASAHPERTWECSHIGGDRFAANVVVLPHGLFYGHVPPTRALELARQYDQGVVVPDLLRGSGAFVPPVQAAQHFARAAGHSLAVGNLLPQQVQALSDDRWRILLASTNGPITVEVSAHLDTVDARLTCAGPAPTQVRAFNLHTLTSTP
ncbi:sucrase ferredoxin [Kribbella sp. NPDC048928]|uniref:sucrase ferredoxin n=1 Tax=Kribbella sp. NPDC048928 TaxID=3364111 RepID=UPI003723EEE7